MEFEALGFRIKEVKKEMGKGARNEPRKVGKGAKKEAQGPSPVYASVAAGGGGQPLPSKAPSKPVPQRPLSWPTWPKSKALVKQPAPETLNPKLK